MNEQDLRVVKTKTNIKNAFLKLLKKKPVEKISVTELSRQAQINKSTFYLHYQDIYALYSEVRDEFLQQMTQSMDYCSLLLTDPEAFLGRLFETLQKNREQINFLWPKHDIFLFQPNLNDRIVAKIYQDYPVEKCVRNDMVLETLIETVFRLFYVYGEKEPEVIGEILLSMVHTFFPHLDPALAN